MMNLALSFTLLATRAPTIRRSASDPQAVGGKHALISGEALCSELS